MLSEPVPLLSAGDLVQNLVSVKNKRLKSKFFECSDFDMDASDCDRKSEKSLI